MRAVIAAAVAILAVCASGSRAHVGAECSPEITAAQAAGKRNTDAMNANVPIAEEAVRVLVLHAAAMPEGSEHHVDSELLAKTLRDVLDQFLRALQSQDAALTAAGKLIACAARAQ